MRGLLGLAIVLAILSPGLAAAQEQALDSDFSRGQLFQRYVRGQTGGLLSLNSDFHFPADVDAFREKAQPPDHKAMFGIDLSHHNIDNCNCTIDWTEMRKAGVMYAYLKASQGTTSYDSKFTTYWQGISALPADQKIYKGAYHFLSADGTGEAQGAYFIRNIDARLSQVGAARAADDLPAVVDLEWDHRVRKNGERAPCSDGKIYKDCWELVSADDIIKTVNAWIAAVQASTGKTPAVYTNRSWWMDRVKDEKRFAEINTNTIWIAYYLPHDSKPDAKPEKPAKPVAEKTLLNVAPQTPGDRAAELWQFSESADFQGNAKIGLGKVDASIFKGGLDAFKTEFGLP